jgi:preprotein translocase subunit Sec63
VVLRSAVRYVELVFGRDAAEDARRRAERAKARRKRGQSRRSNGTSRWSPAEVLGVDANASTEEITAAYRELATQYHPDKVASLADEFRELAERRMKEINAAYRALTHRS